MTCYKDIHAARFVCLWLFQVDASCDEFLFYAGGVMDTGCGASNDHAIVLVGFNADAVPPYWVAKNR